VKIIFLDIDGVLNTDRIDRMRKNHNISTIDFDPEALKNLSKIVIETNAKLVISSSWRVHQNTDTPLWNALIDNLKKCNLEKEIFDITEVHGGIIKRQPRWKEISNWLLKSKELDISSYVILDDEWDMDFLSMNFVRCSSSVGISDKNCIDAIAILNRTGNVA
jgi:flagellin-specific chaperone FliS